MPERWSIVEILSRVAHEYLQTHEAFRRSLGLLGAVGPYQRSLALSNEQRPWEKRDTSPGMGEQSKCDFQPIRTMWDHLAQQVSTYCKVPVLLLAEQMICVKDGRLFNPHLQQSFERAQAEGKADEWLAELWGGWPSLCKRLEIPPESSLIGSYGGRGGQPRITIDPDNDVAVVDSQSYSLTPDQTQILQKLLQAKGGWVPAKHFFPDITPQPRGDRMVKRMPSEVKQFIKSGTGKGYRLTTFGPPHQSGIT